jgi:hypothetical protein
MSELIRVRQAKHGKGTRFNGRRNWVVTDTDGQVLVFISHDLAVAAADQLARTGTINPTGLVGCQRGDF